MSNHLQTVFYLPLKAVGAVRQTRSQGPKPDTYVYTAFPDTKKNSFFTSASAVPTVIKIW